MNKLYPFLGLETQWFGSPNFTFFEFSLHRHAKGDDECAFRFGIILAVLGVLIKVGAVRAA